MAEGVGSADELEAARGLLASLGHVHDAPSLLEALVARPDADAPLLCRARALMLAWPALERREGACGWRARALFLLSLAHSVWHAVAAARSAGQVCAAYNALYAAAGEDRVRERALRAHKSAELVLVVVARLEQLRAAGVDPLPKVEVRVLVEFLRHVSYLLAERWQAALDLWWDRYAVVLPASMRAVYARLDVAAHVGGSSSAPRAALRRSSSGEGAEFVGADKKQLKTALLTQCSVGETGAVGAKRPPSESLSALRSRDKDKRRRTNRGAAVAAAPQRKLSVKTKSVP